MTLNVVRVDLHRSFLNWLASFKILLLRFDPGRAAVRVPSGRHCYFTVKGMSPSVTVPVDDLATQCSM